MGFQRDAAILLELLGFGGGGSDDAVGFRFGAGGALLVIGQQGGSLGAQSPSFVQFGRDHRGALVQNLGDHARTALPDEQGDDQHKADSDPEFRFVEHFHVSSPTPR